MHGLPTLGIDVDNMLLDVPIIGVPKTTKRHEHQTLKITYRSDDADRSAWANIPFRDCLRVQHTVEPPVDLLRRQREHAVLFVTIEEQPPNFEPIRFGRYAYMTK